MKLKTTLVAAQLLLSITSAQAELVESDWKNTGDALATLDTDTGIEWLDLTQTDNMSINQAEGLTGAVGIFDGWRLPSRAEVTQMMLNAFSSQSEFLQGAGYNFQHTVDNPGPKFDNESLEFGRLLGRTHSVRDRVFTYGMFKHDITGTNQPLMSGNYYTTSYSRVNINLNSVFNADYDYAHEAYGVYLVSRGGATLSSQLDPSINVPVADASTAPTTLGLMGLATLGFTVRRRSTATLK
jgi:hypothetical protein